MDIPLRQSLIFHLTRPFGRYAEVVGVLLTHLRLLWTVLRPYFQLRRFLKVMFNSYIMNRPYITETVL